MKILRIFAILIAMFFSVSAFSEEEKTVTVTQEEVCLLFGDDATKFATIYSTPGNTKEDVAEFIIARNEEFPIYSTFLPGNVLTLGVMLNFQPEEYTSDAITEFGKTTYEMCMATIALDTLKWIQEIPGSSKIIPPEDDEYETGGPSVIKEPEKVMM